MWCEKVGLRDGNGGKRITLPLHPLIADVARDMPSRRSWFPSHSDPSRPTARISCSDGIRRAMHRLGVPGSGSPSEALVHVLAAGARRDVRVVQTLMRHASLATTTICTRVSPAMQREALDHQPMFDWTRAA